MDSKKYFDTYYSSHQEMHFSQSLLNFFETIVRPRLNSEPEKVLDIGCGNFSIFEKVQNFHSQISAIDFSSTAISQAPKSKIVYLEKSVTDESFFNENEFDLIFDSHCLNCLIEDQDRKQAFDNIFKALKEDGMLASELMVQPIDKKMEIPLKRIKTAREIEEELLQHHFQIIYFMISRDSSFVNEVNGEVVICDVLRVIAKKN